MDMYCYFLERFREGGNPYSAFERCEGIVAELVDNPRIPARVTLAVTTDLLSAITDFAGSGCAVSASFRRIRQLVEDVFIRMQSICRTEDQVWRREQAELEGIPTFDPSDYECWPPDFDNGEDEGGEEGGAPEGGVDDPFDIIQESFCSSCCSTDPGHDRRPFPDWANIGNWTSRDWVRFGVWKEKVLAVALMRRVDLAYIVTDAIAAIKANIDKFPEARQAEACAWCQTLVDELHTSLEASLDQVTTNICRSGQ